MIPLILNFPKHTWNFGDCDQPITVSLMISTFSNRVIGSLRSRARRRRTDVCQLRFYLGLAARRRARLRDPITDGVTVLTVSWDTKEFLEALVHGFRRYTDDPSVRLLVVDNNSTDGTRAYLATQPDIDTVFLKRNIGHGLALDAGIQAATTRFVITLDIDAFPIAHTWIDTLINPLRNGHTLAGGWTGYIHPSYTAIERRYFLAQKYSFAASYNRRIRLPSRRNPKDYDAGELIDFRDDGPHFKVDISGQRGPGALGTVFGGQVYHHFYATRMAAATVADDIARAGVTTEASRAAWDEAIAMYLAN